MATAFDNVIGRIRQPEYTGENRCIPCTIINLIITAIAAILGAGLVAYYNYGTGLALLFGLGVIAIGSGLIYLRGYLVPGTPWLTRTYFPDRVLRWFDKHPIETQDGEFDTEAFLKGLDAVEECVNVDDLCLTDGFREAWQARIAELHEKDTSREDLAGILGINPTKLEFKDHGDAFTARANGHQIGQWESHAAFLADVAAANEFRTRYAEWESVGVERQGEILNGLRLFLEECPACGGRVELAEEVVRSCCRSIDVIAVTCQDCEARLFEAEQPA